MEATLRVIQGCIDYLKHNVDDLTPELREWYDQAISDLDSYLIDEQERFDYEYADNDFVTDCHPEYAEVF